jgi:serine/threonine protein kinase/tetratricopeptide (TPR) repeat protein
MAADRNRVRDVFRAAVEVAPEQQSGFLTDACGDDAELRAEVERLLTVNADPESILDPPAPAPADATASFVASHPATVLLPGGTPATDAADPGAPSPTDMADEDSGPYGATGTLASPDPHATTAAASASSSPHAAGAPTGEGIGTVIAGRYTLVEVIGEGGMGSVYRASQTEPVKRQVALKLIKTGMDSRGVLARFDAERQALALMDHPNIARIYDGGLTPAGQPFFVMELVKGVPLTEYCDRQRLTVQSRLELFVSVCQAVQHAHQKGIIHRDLKPGNVLVTEVDGRPTPKVIDFGVAKATEVKLTDMSLADVGAIVGTPTYMSPEQADPSSMDIDTRTDVYALGVMLYELLTGSPPIDAKQFQRGAILEMLRMVREVDPPRPSTKLSTAEALPNIAANRSIEPARLARLLQGELDWVVMKALEKDRTRRYETANGLARDIQRYLADEVVEARPPSQGYRLRKFIKRNKIQVIAASLVFVTLVGGIIGTSLGMASARRAEKAEAKQRGIADSQRDKALAAERQTAIERDKALAAERQTAIERDKALAAERQTALERDRALAAERQTALERDRALAAEAKTKTINDFLMKDLLIQAEPAKNAVEDKVTLVEVLDRAAEKVGMRFAGQPELERSLRETIGRTYHGLASWEKAEAQWRAVLDAARKRDPQSADAYEAQGEVAHILRHRGRRDAEFLELSESAAKGLERTLGPDHHSTLGTLQNLASAYEEVGRFPEAIALLERVRDAQMAKHGPDHQSTLSALNNLATAYDSAGKLPEAIALFERVRYAQIAKLGPDHPDTLFTLHNLAGAYWEVGRLPEAIALYGRVRDARIAKLGPDHPDTLMTLHNLAVVYKAAGRVPEAIALHERVRDAQTAQLGPDHPDTLSTLSDLAGSYEAAGRLPEAIALYERVRDARIAKLGPDHPNTLGTLNNLGTAYWSTKQLDKSVPLFEDALERFEAKFGRQHVDTQRTVANLGVNYKDAGRLKEAIPLLEEAYRAARRFPMLRFVDFQLVDAYTKAGETAKLADLLREQLAEARRTLPKDSPQMAGRLAQIGTSLLQQKQWTEAEPLLRECLAIREKTQSNVWFTFNTQSMLGGALLGQKKYAEAEPLLRKGYEGMKQREKTIPPQAVSRIVEALDRLIDLSTATNKPEEVKKWQAERAKYPESAPPHEEKK